MLGLVVRFRDLPPIRAAIRGDGVVSVIASVVRTRHGRRLRHESRIGIGGLVPPDRDGKWLLRNLRREDQVRVAVASVGRPSPFRGRRLPQPRRPVRPANGLEVFLNGRHFARATVHDRRVVFAVVTWCRGTKGRPQGREELDLDFGTERHRRLSVGDEVLIRVL